MSFALLAGPSRRALGASASVRALPVVTIATRTAPITHSQARSHARALTTTAPACSGHSRWSKIRHKKGAVDAQRGAYFSRLMGEVHLALRPPASHDPTLNARLAAALEKAKAGGVPKTNIEAAFARARKMADGTGKSVVFEAVGAGGKVAFMVECLTENPARTVSRVKEILHKGGSRVTPVAFLFDRKGVVRVSAVPGSAASFDSLFDAALEGGAEDVRELEPDEDASPNTNANASASETTPAPVWEVISAPNDLGSLTSLLTTAPNDALYALESSELAFIPLDPVAIIPEGEQGDGLPEERAVTVMKTVDMLEEEPDVVKVWTNIAE